MSEPNNKTVAKLVEDIYEDNYSHLDFMENMNGGECDCNVCCALELIIKYWGE